MDTNEEMKNISEEIKKAAPAFEPAYIWEALNNTKVNLFRYFPKLKMIVLTERLCMDFHVKPVYHDMPGSFADDFVTEQDRRIFEQMYYDIDGGKPSASAVFRGKDQKTWCHVTLTVVEWDEEHRPELCTGVVEDHSEEEIAREELNNILSSISCGILQYRQSDNKLLRANKAALDILGYASVEEMIADRADGIVGTVVPEDHEYMKTLLDSISGPGEIKTIEYRVQHKGSDEIRYCYGTMQVFDNINGERIIQRSIMDITDRKIREDMQHTNNELMQRLDAIMEGISGGFMITLDDEKISYAFVSESIAAIQGYTIDEFMEVTHGNAPDNVYPEDRERVLSERKMQYAKGDTYFVQYRVVHKDGSIRWITDNGKKVVDKDGNIQHYSLIQDITEQQERIEEVSRLLTMQKQMVGSLSCGVFAYTLPERKILIINKEAQRLFKYNNSNHRAWMDNMLADLLPEDYGNMREAVKKMKETGDSGQYKLHPLTEDGGRVTIECYTKLRAFEDGKQFVLSVLQDVTKAEERTNELNEMTVMQQKMIEEIRRERQQYRDALLSGCEYSYRYDVTEGIVYSDFDYSVRGNLMQNLGLSLPVSYDEMVRRWVEVMKPEFLTPEQKLLLNEEVKACYEKGQKHIVTEYYNTTEKAYYRRTMLLSKDDETGHLWAIAIINNITDSVREETRMRNELALVNRDLRNQIGISQAFSSIYFGSWEVNLEAGRITEISVPEWAHTIQERSDGDYREAVGLMLNELVLEENRKAMEKFLNMDTMAERLKNENILACEYQDERLGWCTASLIPHMRDEDGDVIRVIFAVRGIGNEKKIELETKQALEDAYEAANRANAAKTEFLASISHDIRTPMNGIIGMTAIAGTHLDDRERVADCLAKISISSKHLLGLINEVLDMNKIESGKLDLNAEEFNLADLVDNLLVMSKLQLENKGQELSVNIHDVEHENVIGDSLRIQQVFMNLLNNSIKYTPEGGRIKIVLSEKPTNRPKIGCYEFVIEDNGIGMDQEFLQHLFEPFTRAKDQRVEKIQGTGLGMPIARNIVRMMNGDIKVESVPSKGTKFTVTIFLELQEEDGDLCIEDFIDLPVLVADDDEMACESTCGMLEELGMKGEWVLTGEEAVERTVAHHRAQQDYFAVILDWKMPGMDGLMTAKAIRKEIGDEVPIIIISAYDWSDIEQEARAAGVNAFISKPLFKSRVSFLFKGLLGKNSQDSDMSELDQLSESDFSGKRALLAEDNELNSEIAVEIFGMFHLEVEVAKNGKEAVDMMESKPEGYYDIIFMDIQMPVMNGYEASRAIRSLARKDIKAMPIVAMTANAFAEDVQAAKNAGMNEHLAKPLNIAQLIKTLKRWLG